MPGAPARMSRYYSGPVSDHFDGTRFFGPRPSGDKGLGPLLKWQLAGGRAKWPKWIENQQFPSPPERVLGESVRLTMIGHVTVLIQTEGMNILTDPVWSSRASPSQYAGPKRVRAPGIAMDALPPIDLILVSHNHYDHLDTATLANLVRRFDPLIITPLGNDTIIRKAAPTARITALDWDARTEFGGLGIEAEPVNHWSARWSTDRNEALWAGLTVHAPTKRLFFNGDSGFAEGWWADRLIKKHKRIDVSLSPIGAYAPRWFMEDAHMDPDEAVEIFKRLGEPATLGYHWGVFQLTDEPINEPAERLAAALSRERIDPALFRTLEPGEAWEIP
jgi:L-ascorbate metabolism protein UlaG (beta-lactamase superfamily)